MIKIELSNASNGIIKRISETSYAEDSSDKIKVYVIDSESEKFYESITELLEDLCVDLSLDTGSDFDPVQLYIDTGWGEKYIPTEIEIDEKIKDLREELSILKSLKKQIKQVDVA